MSTNATIAIERENGTRTAIYCHWDGHIKRAGATLQLAYNTAESIENLLKLGDLSVLGYYTDPTDTTEKMHDFENRQRQVCVAYCRDRGDPFLQSDTVQEFNYIFDERDACWYVEKETFIRDTDGMNLLGLNSIISYPRTLLLDELSKCDFTHWKDDELAKAGEVVEKCKEKALEARNEIIKREREKRLAYYRAYCD